MIPVWFFVGVILLIYGVIILGTGIYEFSSPPPTVLANTHPAVWWGALLTVIGGIYVYLYKPKKILEMTIVRRPRAGWRYVPSRRALSHFLDGLISRSRTNRSSGIPRSFDPNGDIFASGAYSSSKSSAMRARWTRSRPILTARSSMCSPRDRCPAHCANRI